ncbi:MAG TPA: hypothetical protein VMY78_05720 [Solirubrobacteraceae bacterium]|nr:hypothetical protein [Solirubrobacteraceae bacterium]
MLLSRLSAPAAAPLLPRLSAPRPIVLTRITAIGALALLLLSVTAIVMAGKTTLPLAAADAHYINARVVGIDQGVRTRLVRLDESSGLALARGNTREAIAELNALSRPVYGAAGGEGLQRAIQAELRFLDAVGSVLSNPRSPLRDELASLDAVARGAIAALDGPVARRKGGANALRRLWSGRGAGSAAAA